MVEMVKININKRDYESDREPERSKSRVKKKIRKMRTREDK
jgi:hypothetical protein